MIHALCYTPYLINQIANTRIPLVPIKWFGIPVTVEIYRKIITFQFKTTYTQYYLLGISFVPISRFAVLSHFSNIKIIETKK